MFAKFLKSVTDPAAKIAEATGKQIEREFQREADRAAARLAKRAAKEASRRIVGLFAAIAHAPQGETADEYYARTGQLREDDWGGGEV